MKNRILKRMEACVLAGFLAFAPLVDAVPAYAANDGNTAIEATYEMEEDVHDDIESEEFDIGTTEEDDVSQEDSAISDSDVEKEYVDAEESGAEYVDNEGISADDEMPVDLAAIEIIEENIETAEAEAVCYSMAEEDAAVFSLNAAAATSSATNVVVGDLFNITDLYTGAVASHDCNLYLKKAYDGDNHWDQCSVCDKKYNTKSHSFTTMGDDTCGWWNSGQTRYCATCGYKTVYRRSHIDDTSKWYTRTDQKYHYHKCNYCNSFGNAAESCKDANGNVITCAGGTCAVCGYTYSPSHVYYNSGGGESGTISCHKCGVDLIRFDSNTGSWSGANTYNASVRIIWWNPDIYGTNAAELANTVGVGGTGSGTTGEVSNLTATVKSGYIYASCTITFPYSERTADWACEVWSLQPYSTRIQTAMYGGKIENVAPTIQSANLTYGTKSGGYATKATLSVTCTDNWLDNPNYVQVRLLNEKKEALTNWLTCGKSGSTFSQSIDVVSEVTGSTNYYVQAKDAGGNVSERAVNVSNLDSRAPAITSAIATSQDWSNMKTLTITCTDEGVGDVSIAFNNTSDYKKATRNGNTYSRSFTFTGEVYGKTKAAVYIKDAVGNVTTEFIEIYNLDNTNPTIESVSIVDALNSSNEAYAWEVNVAGNDINKSLSKSGAGITGYALTNNKSKPSASMYTANVPIATHSGTYYVWVRDGAGNVTMADNPIVIHSDLSYNGREINGAQYNGKALNYFRYNGKLIRL